MQPDGSVALPYLRPLIVAGKSQTEVAALIKKSLIDARVYGDDCNVDVTVMEYRSSTLTVQGAVRNPGKISMTADRLNINDAIGKAGGLQPTAGSEIRVKRAGGRQAPPESQVKDGWEIYSRAELDSGTLIDIQLYDNDIIDVPVAPRFFVTGFVNNVGDFQWEPNLTLERALFKAGGAKSEGALNRIKVRRINPTTKRPEEVKLPGKEVDKMAFIIEPNDVIEVPKKRM